MTNFFANLPLLLGSTEAGAAGGSGQMVTTFVTFGLVILIFYFLIIRPQNKKQKEAKKMIEALKKGDKVVTIGGIHGTVVSVKDQSTVVKVDDNTKLEFSKSAVSSVVSEGKA
ncbi:MAG: preprotein translocase subunit YajC [Spirochaetales bacterium]|nr:preprotein translocase subunit YajC [Spirochaetales bacterium]